MKRLYLINSLIIPFRDEKPAMFVASRLKKEDFIKVYKECKEDPTWEIISAIGHEEIVEFLKDILQDEIELSRREIFLDEGDYALVIKIEERSKEFGKSYSVDEMKKLDEEGKIGYYIISRVPYVESIRIDFIGGE